MPREGGSHERCRYRLAAVDRDELMHSLQRGGENELARARVRLAQPQGRCTPFELGEARARAWRHRDPRRCGRV